MRQSDLGLMKAELQMMRHRFFCEQLLLTFVYHDDISKCGDWIMNVEERVKDLSYITGVINAMARSDDLDFCYTEHCLERMRERNITVSDLLFVLKTGTIEEYQGVAKHYSRKIHKYKITGTHLYKNREISLIILVEINRLKNPAIKLQDIVTTMWKD